MLVDGLKKLLTTHFFRSEREALNRIYHESNKQNKTKQTNKKTHTQAKNSLCTKLLKHQLKNYAHVRCTIFCSDSHLIPLGCSFAIAD